MCSSYADVLMQMYIGKVLCNQILQRGSSFPSFLLLVCNSLLFFLLFRTLMAAVVEANEIAFHKETRINS